MKTDVLIIDEGNRINSILTSGKNDLLGKYEFHLVDNVTKVMEAIQKSEIEIVVSNLTLDDRNEIEILTKIKDEYPQIFIVTIVSQENKLSVNDIYRFAHQILSAPCDFDKLILSFARRDRMVKYLHDGKLMGIINKVNDLPTIPETYIRLENELNSSNMSLQRISSILSEDLSFTVKILHIVNSPFFGLKYRINNVLQAVSLLGVNIIKSLVLYHHTFSISPIGPRHQKYFEELWLHSNKVGRYAEQILFDTTSNEIELMEEAYIAGLLHDIGKIVMLSVDGYPDNIFSMVENKKIRFTNAEYNIYGTSHSEIGAYFLTLWGLPERTANAVFSHNNPTMVDFNKFTVENAVFIANLLAHDKNLDLHDMQKLNLGVHPQDWVNYLEEHNLMKEPPEKND
ncbi:MAG: HDOD domain-containing protein [Bacteroidetes bacterium]|nr:HDOD domain-containing protein [Bacteroidota bacterium]